MMSNLISFNIMPNFIMDSLQDLENDLKRAKSYFDTEGRWGGSEWALEQQSIKNEIAWLEDKIKQYKEHGYYI